MEFILASQSPRRKEILNMLQIDFEQESSQIEEVMAKGIKPELNAMAVAFEKALDVAKRHPSKTVIAADTIVVFEDEILGKPLDDEDALKMLKMLNGKSHYVYSGLSLINLKRRVKIVDFECTKVQFKNNPIETLLSYVETQEPSDKAGAYGIQGLGSLLIDSFHGDFFNVMGLPIDKLNANLIKYFDYKIL